MKLIVKTFKGFEEILAGEIKSLLGKKADIGRRSVIFDGTMSDIYLLNYKSRYALRILAAIDTFDIHSYKDVYDAVYSIDWDEYFSPDKTLYIESTVYSEFFKNSQYITHLSKDAIVDQFNENLGRRPSISKQTADIRINIHISERTLNVNIDSSGDALFKRGYKNVTSEAPLNEVLAAGLIQLSEWDKVTPLLDPMCGSGTFLYEAALLKYDIPSQYFRETFSFLHWNDFDQSLWSGIKQESIDISAVKHSIKGADKLEYLTDEIESSIQKSVFKSMIEVSSGDFFNTDALEEAHHIIFNPPYDKRLSLDDHKLFYKNIGDTLKQRCKGSTAWVFSGNKEGIKFVGLRPSKKLMLYNGPIEAKFHKFEIF